MFFNFQGYSGWDVFLSFLPKKTQTRRVALAWIAHVTTPDGVRPNLTKTPMILQMPWGSYRLVSYLGEVEAVNREHFASP